MEKKRILGKFDFKKLNIKESGEKVKTYFKEMPKKKRITILAIAAAVILAAIVLTISLNSTPKTKYVSLYSDLSTAEASDIYQALIDMGADVKVGAKTQIMVPENEYDIWLLKLAAKGYPKSALSYDVYSSHSSMTTTESDKAMWLNAQLQDRIQSTLERMDCVETATVTISVPETSDYVWESATNKEKSTASVLISLKKDTNITGEQVSAIKNLVAAAVPKMQPEDVKVVDAATMLELTEETGSNSTANESGLDFELMVQKQIEDNVVRLLTRRYGSDGVVAVAKVTIDYDKMMTESYQVNPNPSDPQNGVATHSEGSYSVNGNQTAGDVVGEENNTDVPKYGYTSPDADGGLTDYTWSKDYDYSYIKKQIESGNAILKRATVSVLVNDKSLTAATKEDIINLVSNATDIPTDLISVSAYQLPAAVTTPTTGGNDTTKPTNTSPAPSHSFDFSKLNIFNLPIWVYLAAGVALLALFILITVLKKRKKKKAEDAAREQAEAEERARIEEEQRQQQEIENYKHSLESLAKGDIDPKNEAILEDVRSFAKENPQIAANLIRSWMKEG
jgi:flagellar M-ring protein FliF